MTLPRNLVRPVTLGRLRLANNLVLAPMHKRTHLAMRLLARRAGAALAHTEMATPEEILGNDPRYQPSYRRRLAALLASTPEDRPLGIQILPCDPGPLAEAVARLAARDAGDLVDLNFACPSRRVAGSGRGASFLQDPELAVRLVEAAVRAAGPLPVTIKVRCGWTNSPDHRERAMELARGAAAAGAVAVTLHARSAAQQYHDKADWGIIAAWAEALAPVPVFGSGDLRGPEAVLDMLRQTGCAGASIARGALGTPWIFRQVLDLDATGAYRPVTAEERARAFLEHYDGLALQYGEASALRQIAQIGRMYARDLRGAAEIRTLIQNLRTSDDVRQIAERLRAAAVEHAAGDANEDEE